MVIDMDLGFNTGTTVQCTKAIEITTSQTGMAVLSTRMGMPMKASGLMTRQKVKAGTSTSMEQFTMETGSRISKRGMVLRYGRMGLSIRDITSKGRRKEKGILLGAMDRNIKVNFWIITSMVLVSINGQMEELTKANG